MDWIDLARDSDIGEVNTQSWWGKAEVKRTPENLGLDGRILKWIFKKWDEEGGRGFD